MVNVGPGDLEYHVPLISHNVLGMFRDEREGGPETWSSTEVRHFRRDKDVQPFGDDHYAVFREKP
jgi:hypothetical protein